MKTVWSCLFLSNRVRFALHHRSGSRHYSESYREAGSGRERSRSRERGGGLILGDRGLERGSERGAVNVERIGGGGGGGSGVAEHYREER